MRKFDKRFQARQREIERNIARTQKWAIVASVVYISVACLILVFLGFVIVGVLQHFSIF